MKKKKSTKLLVPIVLSGLAALLYALSGQRHRDVYLRDFSVSPDGETLILEVGVRGRGSVRGISTSGEGESVSVSFYSAYGGNVGASQVFPLRLPKSCTKLYFGFGEARVLTIEKQNGKWERV